MKYDIRSNKTCCFVHHLSKFSSKTDNQVTWSTHYLRITTIPPTWYEDFQRRCDGKLKLLQFLCLRFNAYWIVSCGPSIFHWPSASFLP